MIKHNTEKNIMSLVEEIKEEDEDKWGISNDSVL